MAGSPQACVPTNAPSCCPWWPACPCTSRCPLWYPACSRSRRSPRGCVAAPLCVAASSALNRAAGQYCVTDEKGRVFVPPCVSLSHESIADSGMYLLDDGRSLYMWIGGSVDPYVAARTHACAAADRRTDVRSGMLQTTFDVDIMSEPRPPTSQWRCVPGVPCRLWAVRFTGACAGCLISTSTTRCTSRRAFTRCCTSCGPRRATTRSWPSCRTCRGGSSWARAWSRRSL